ncbi:MAG: hypothetical protein LQ349_000501 [Xanthoria aureola]|nr:MAG: hypothetical protein LQ349_000501 [Xanthoria aureola]
MEAYADTPREVLETIDYLEQLKHQIVRPASDDNQCSICLEPFSSAGRGHANHSSAEAEMPVSLPCGHIIGFKCMERYLSPFGEARNSCPLCRRKLFEAPYMPDTVTKLRARLEAFDDYFQQHPQNARPDRTHRLRDLLWQFSRTTKTVPEELRHAKREAETATLVYDRLLHPTTGTPRRRPTPFTVVGLQSPLEIVDRRPRGRRDVIQQQAQRGQRGNAELERTRPVAEDSWGSDDSSESDDLWEFGEQHPVELMNQQQLNRSEAREVGSQLARQRAEELGSRRLSREDNRGQVGQAAQGWRERMLSARLGHLNQAVQQGQGHEQLPNEARQQQARPIREASEDAEDDFVAYDYPPLRGWGHQARRASGILQGHRRLQSPTEAGQPVPETPPRAGPPQAWLDPWGATYQMMMGPARPLQQAPPTTPTVTPPHNRRTQLGRSGAHALTPTYAEIVQRDPAPPTTTQTDELNAREQRLDALRRSLEARERALERRHQALEERELRVAQREGAADARSELHHRESTFNGPRFFGRYDRRHWTGTP